MKKNKTEPFCSKVICSEETVLDQLDENFWREVEYYVQNLT
jgi:hypothetical protein